MSNNEFNLDFIGCLQQTKSKRQINADIRQIEKAINMLRITGTLAKGDTKREINTYIKELSEKLGYVKLKGKIDEKNLKQEINKSLHNMSFEDIDALKVDENKTKLKLKKVISDVKAYAEKNTISVNVGMKKEKLNNDLTTFLNKNTKIRESSFLLEESERIRELINSVDDKGTLKDATEAFQLYKSEVSATGYATKSTSDKIKAMLSHITKIGSFFGLASLAVNNFRKSLSTLKGNDTILTEISKTSEMTKKQLEELNNEAFKVASRYGKLSSDYLLSVQDMSRAGYLNSNSMAELSIAAQGAGDMTAELANKYIIAMDKAFKMNGSVEALTATLDGANNITNHNAVNMTELGTSMSIVGSQAASAGLEVNETTAAIATMIAVTQRSGSEMGNAFKGILMNLRQVSGDVGDGENIIDAESLTKYEKACAELGVSLKEVRNGVVSLKEPMQIIKELSEEYTKLDEADTRRANLLSAVGGKYRANALNSLLENYDMYSKMLDEYANGLGSMNEEAEKTANSWEGRLNALQNSIDSFFNTLTNKDAIKGGISFFDRLIQGAEALTNTIGEIPVVLTAVNTAMTAMNKDYGITQVYNKEKGKIDVQGNIFGIDITNIKNLKKHFAEAEEAISIWNNKLKSGKANIESFNYSVVQHNAQFKEYLSTCKDVPASIEGYKNHLREAGVNTDALRLKTILLNSAITMLGGWAIGQAISLIVKGIDNLIHKVEKARERTDELFNEFKEMNDTLSEHKKTVAELADRYDELSKKVNLSNNANISLSTDEYEEFLDINERLVKSFPELAKGIDENGNSILTLGTKGITAKEQLEELLQTEEDLNNFRIAQGLGDAFKGVYTYVEDANGATEQLTSSINGANEQIGVLQDYIENGIELKKDNYLLFKGDITDTAKTNYGYAMQSAAREFLDGLDDNRRMDLYNKGLDVHGLFTMNTDELTGAFDFYANLYSLEPNEIKRLEGLISDNVSTLKGALKDQFSNQEQEVTATINQAQNSWRDFIPNLVSGMKSKQTFKDLDSDLQDIAVQIVEGLDYSYANAMNEWNPTDPYAYIRDKLIVPMGNLSDDNKQLIKDSFTKLMTLDAKDISQSNQAEITKLIDTIADLLEKDHLEIRFALGFDVEDSQKRYNEALKEAKRQLGGYGHDDRGFEINNVVGYSLDDFWSKNVTTEKDLVLWGKVTEGITDAVKAMGIYTEAKKNAADVDDPPASFSTFTNSDFGTRIQHITDMFNEGTISHKEYFDALQSEIDNFDASNFTDSIEDMDKASAQFFVDSMQQAASGLSGLINSFDSGEMSISEYLEGYLAIGNTLSTLTDNLQENSAAWNEHGEAISEVGNTALDDTQNKLNSAMSIIESYQDSIYSLEQIMNDAVTVGSDEFTAHANVIAEDLYNIVQTGGEMADTIASTLGTTTSEIAQSLTENVSNQEIACQAIMANTNNAITSMADSIGELFDTLGDAISNFKVDLSFGVKSIDWKKVNVLGAELSLPEIKFELGASGESLDKIGSALSSFGKTIASNYTPQTIELEDFHFGSTDAAKDRKYSPGSDITNNYENALDRIKGATSAAKSEFEEMVDFFERRKDVINNAVDLLKANLENVTGSFAKNQLLNQNSNILEESMRNYSDAIKMYQEKAQESLSKLDLETQKKIIDGSVSLTDYIGEGNKVVVEAINDYSKWSEKVAEHTEKLANLKEELRQLELQKFNNIMDDFKNQFDLRDDSKDLISKQIDLLKEAGELIGESFFTAQIDQSKKQLELLENEKAQLVNQMSSAISSGRIQSGTDEWLEMVNALSDVDGSILDCKKSIEEFDNSILELHTEIFDRIQDQFSNLDSEISNFIDLFDDFEVSDDKGIWSKEAIAQLGLLSQQYELAQYRVQQYNDEIDELNAQYLSGKYSATEYADKLAELNSEQWNAIKTAESAKDALMDLNETRIENQIKGIEKEIDAYKELTDSQISALKASKDLHDYEKSIAEKTKSITDLERQIAAMQNDTSAATVAKRKKLEEQLAEAKKDLEEAEYEHSIEVQEDALNKQYEQYEKERNDEIDALRESLNDKETILANSFETVKANASTVGQEIATIAAQHGITVSKSLISSWQSGENAIASYGEVLSQNTSVFIGNIMDVENEVWNLQAQANTTADSLAWMFSTKADNLVNELNTSYFAEANLANMTNALQQSLVNTLERGYDVSSIVNSLNSVAGAANSAKAAIDSLNNSNAAGENISKNLNAQKQIKQPNQQYQLIDKTTGRIWKDNLSYAEALEYKKDHVTDINTTLVKKYASGARNIEEDQLAITNEAGQELVYHAADGSILTPLRQGDKVFSNEAVERLWEIGQGLIPQDMFKNLAMPTVLPNNVNNNSVNNYYDSMFAFNGDVIDADRAIKQMEKVAIKIADRQIDKNWRDFSNQLRYGGSAALMRHR